MPLTIDREQLDRMARVIATRRSVRRYAPRPVAREIVEELLHCAANAPSAHNRQPWRFAVLREPASKAKLAEAMGSRLRADRLRDGDPADIVQADVARSHERITQAPVVLVVASTVSEMDRYPDRARQQAEYLMAVQSTAMAVQNLLLCAHAAGLAGCWMCAPLFCPETVCAVLDLPCDWQPQAIVTLGYAASQARPRPRRPLAEIVRHVEEP
jgi:F420 biosynthesis protein FbiB-like protein